MYGNNGGKKTLQQHKKLQECKIGMGFITWLEGTICHSFLQFAKLKPTCPPTL